MNKKVMASMLAAALTVSAVGLTGCGGSKTAEPAEQANSFT